MAAGNAATALAPAAVDDPAVEALFEHVARRD